MLMVVFGAGASYDSSSSFPLNRYPGDQGNNPYNDFDRLSLANQLFEERPFFVALRERFPRCLAVVPYLQSLSRNIDVEHELGKLQSESKKDPEVPKQLAAIRSYLEIMIWECQRRWASRTHGVTNYNTILNQIRQWKPPNEQVCLVTFNYDTLLEDALPKAGLRPLTLPDLVATDYKIIKLHGSISWARPVNTAIDSPDVFQMANALIERASDLDLGSSYEIATQHPIAKSGNRAFVPALAIPVETKTTYECPKEHIDALDEFLPKVTKLLLIGWRGTEARFVKSLADNILPGTQMMIVSSNAEKAHELANNIRRDGVRAQYLPASNHGFTNFVIAREADEFLER